MTPTRSRHRTVFWDIHSGLPREGPGNREATARALRLAAPLPKNPRVLDIACGPGMQTLDLAQLQTDATIVALDRHWPFTKETNRRATSYGLAGRIKAAAADMRALPFPSAVFDLIWCEGAAYMVGLESALEHWRPMLRPGGKLAVSEPVWLRSDPPDEVRGFWLDGYPGMRTIESCRASCGNTGTVSWVISCSRIQPGGNIMHHCNSGFGYWARNTQALTRPRRPCERLSGKLAITKNFLPITAICSW